MIALETPKVTKYFIKHVDCRNLKVAKETNIRLSLSAMSALNIHNEEENLSVVLGKIQAYQTIYPAKYEFKDLSRNIKKMTLGESIGDYALPVLIGASVVPSILNHVFLSCGNWSDVFNPANALCVLLGTAITGISWSIYHVRRNSANNLLNYFMEANKDISTKSV